MFWMGTIESSNERIQREFAFGLMADVFLVFF